MSQFRLLADNRDPRSLAARLRRRRSELLHSLLAGVPRPARLLDVGGTEAYWQTVAPAGLPGFSIVLLNQRAPAVTRPGFTSIAGDARALPFADRAFDVVFSNSVIEHVGERADQQRMADEVRRVGARFYVQTPNHWFPIEPHFVFPGFQFLPREVRTQLVMRFALGWYPRVPERDRAEEIVDSVRLLTARELCALFPGAQLHRETFAGLAKSLVVTGGF